MTHFSSIATARESLSCRTREGGVSSRSRPGTQLGTVRNVRSAHLKHQRAPTARGALPCDAPISLPRIVETRLGVTLEQRR